MKEEFSFDFLKDVYKREPFEGVIYKEIKKDPCYFIWGIGKNKIFSIEIEICDNADFLKEIDPYGEENWNEKILLIINVNKTDGNIWINFKNEENVNGSKYSVKTNEDGIRLINNMIKAASSQESLFKNRVNKFNPNYKNIIFEKKTTIVNESKKYMTFDDLKFKDHYLKEYFDKISVCPHMQAKMIFKNGYGVSVVVGDMFYSNGHNTYEVMRLDYNNNFIGEPLGYLTEEEVTHEMIKLQKRNPPIQKFTKEDPYGEEDWSNEEIFENINNIDEKLTTVQLWHRYKRFGRKETIDGFRKNILEFKTDSKGLKEYKGRIIGFYPMFNHKTREIIILFDTKEYGVLKINDKYPITIESELNEHLYDN